MTPSADEELDYTVARQFASLAGWRAFLAAHPNGAYARSARAEVARQLGAEGASAGGPAAESPTDNAQRYGLSRRIGSLASNAQAARARVERLLLGETAPASGDLEDPARPLERRAASEFAPSVAPPLSEAVPATDGLRRMRRSWTPSLRTTRRVIRRSLREPMARPARNSRRSLRKTSAGVTRTAWRSFA